MSSGSGTVLLDTPQQISALVFTATNQLITASVDGSVRLYPAGSSKVAKAIRGLGAEVASLAHVTVPKKGAGENGEVWLAVEHKALLFALDSPALILGPTDALRSVVLGAHEADALNEITLNHNATKLAWATDEGLVGVVDLSSASRAVTKMRVKHANISGSVKFIPDRPSELVSGGYDCALLHFDSAQGALLSRADLSAPPPDATSGISLSPPFILCTALSPTGILAAGTADGRVWLGAAGEKTPNTKAKKGAKRSRKWDGLHADGVSVCKVAEGPVVGLAFAGAHTLISCTLLGTLAAHRISRAEEGDREEEGVGLEEVWKREMGALAKVNAIAVAGTAPPGEGEAQGGEKGVRIAVGGVGKDGRGVVEVCMCEV